jgi:hypothetical protein
MKDLLFLSQVASICKARSIFLTEDGEIGLAPKMAREDDIVVVLLGCQVPIILRPTNNTSQYQVVGEAYFQSVMHQEALLGSLPEHFENIQQVDQDGSTSLVYRNLETGSVEVEDPRLVDVDLPRGWRRGSDPSRAYHGRFLNDHTGEITWRRDPRITIEFLKGMGVDLKVFDLI